MITTVNVMDTVEIALELKSLAIDDKLAIANPVDRPPHSRPHIGRMRGIIGKILIAEHKRMIVPLEAQILNDCAPGKDIGGQPAARDRNAVHCLAIGRMAENFGIHVS
jgi:hypothetical protein